VGRNEEGVKLMKVTSILASTSITGVVTAALVVSPALAWHPKGVIVKSVEDQTTNSSVVTNNDTTTALTVNTGDTLQYVVKVSNDGAPANNGDDDMAHTVMTDTLPAGVELVSNPSQREFTVDMGTIKPGDSDSETYTVKVTDTTDGDVITNEACFTGNSIVNDNPQHGCSSVVVKVHVPPSPTPTPTPQTPTTPTSLPNTGAGNVILLAAIITALGYTGYLLRLKLKRNAA
jgi:uncharacterized repeat protein (TIGR01451 family)